MLLMFRPHRRNVYKRKRENQREPREPGLIYLFLFRKKVPAPLFSCGYRAGTTGTFAGTALFGYPVVPVRYPLFFFQRVPFFLSFLCCYVKVPEVPAISHIYAL